MFPPKQSAAIDRPGQRRGQVACRPVPAGLRPRLWFVAIALDAAKPSQHYPAKGAKGNTMVNEAVSVKQACKTLNKLGFHVRDQGDQLLCFHTTKMFDAVIEVENGAADSIRLIQVIKRIQNSQSEPLKNATGGFAPAKEFSRPITVQER